LVSAPSFGPALARRHCAAGRAHSAVLLRCPHVSAEDLCRTFRWRTASATALLVEFGLRAGGEAGARLARKAGVPTSPDTLLRLVRGLGGRAIPTRRVSLSSYLEC